MTGLGTQEPGVEAEPRAAARLLLTLGVLATGRRLEAEDLCLRLRLRLTEFLRGGGGVVGCEMSVWIRRELELEGDICLELDEPSRLEFEFE
jgi:hypothetical protein